MKSIVTFLFCLLAFFANAQSSRILLDLVVNQHQRLDEASRHIPLLQEEFLSIDIQAVKSASLQVFYEMNERVDLGLGITYAEMDMSALLHCNFCFFIGGDRKDPLATKKKLERLQFPLLVHFYPFGKQKRITPFFNGAFIPTKIKKPPLGADHTGAHINYSIGSGLNVRIFPWMKWGLEANLSYQSAVLENVEGYGRFIGFGSRLSFHFLQSKNEVARS